MFSGWWVAGRLQYRYFLPDVTLARQGQGIFNHKKMVTFDLQYYTEYWFMCILFLVYWLYILYGIKFLYRESGFWRFTSRGCRMENSRES